MDKIPDQKARRDAIIFTRRFDPFDQRMMDVGAWSSSI